MHLWYRVEKGLVTNVFLFDLVCFALLYLFIFAFRFLSCLLRWPNTVLARAFADAISHVHKDFKKQTCRQQSDHFIYSTLALSVLFFSIIACSVLMALVFYYNDMLQKVTMGRTQQFSAFVCYRKNTVKYNACAVARKIETDCFSRNAPFSSDPVVRISRN